MVRCYITDRRRLGRSERQRREALLEQVAAVAAAGIEFIHLREKDLDGGALLALARAALTRIGTHGCCLLINDRLDVALASGAAGVHLPAAGLPAAAVRASAPPGFFISVSCHSLAEVTAAAQAGADACVLAPIFATPSKPGAVGLGLEILRAAASSAPVWALGGISEANAAQCRAAGAAGIAGIRYFQPG